MTHWSHLRMQVGEKSRLAHMSFQKLLFTILLHIFRDENIEEGILTLWTANIF